MICMFYLTGEVIDDKITTQCNGEDRYMSNLIKQIIASILESLKDQGTNNSQLLPTLKGSGLAKGSVTR